MSTMPSRRSVLRGVAAIAPLAFPCLRASVVHASRQPSGGSIGPLNADVLPRGIRSRFVNGVNGLRMHALEAGYETPGRPGILLIHGFPELAYSWRHVMGPLAAAGLSRVRPRHARYERTSPAPVDYDADLRPFGTVNRIKDVLALVSAMGHRSPPSSGTTWDRRWRVGVRSRGPTFFARS